MQGGGGGGGAAQKQQQQEERMKQMEDMKNGILSQVLTQEARFGSFYHVFGIKICKWETVKGMNIIL